MIFRSNWCKKSGLIWSFKIRHAEGNYIKTKVKNWKIDYTKNVGANVAENLGGNVALLGGCWVVGLTTPRIFSSKLN